MEHVTRRRIIQYTIGLGASLGLRPWKIFEVNESIFGQALADEAATTPVNRFVCNVMGDGSFAWMTQLFPFTTQAIDGNKAFYTTPDQVRDQPAQPGDHGMKLGPDSPALGGRRMTGFLCGSNEAHTRKPYTAMRVDAGVGMIAAAASIQRASPTLVPVIAIGDMPYGAAAGAPLVASVPDSKGFVDLFSSASSAAGGVLESSSDASLFEAVYKARLALHRAAGKPTLARGMRTAKVAANLVGRNLSGALSPAPDDLVRYGVPEMDPVLADIAKVLITTAKAFRLNLTSNVLVPGMNDDPHTAFDNPDVLVARVRALAKMWDAFVADLSVADPFAAGETIIDNTVIAWVGDTGKDPNTKTSWPDSTPALANWMYVLGAGRLRAGWFGEVVGPESIATWRPETGENVLGGSAGEVAELASPASAAVLYAVAKGDMGRVRQYYRGGAIDGVVR